MKKTWNNITRSKIFFKGCIKDIVIQIVLGLLSMIIGAVIPYIGGDVINTVLAGNYKRIIILMSIRALIAILTTIFSFLISRSYLEFRKKFIFNIRTKTTRAILDSNININAIYGEGEIINKIKSDSNNIAVFLNNVKEGFLVIILNIVIFGYIFYLSKIIGLFYLLSTMVLLGLQYLGVRKSIYYRKKYIEANDKNVNLIGNMIKGAKEIKTLKLKDLFFKKTNDSYDLIGEFDYKSSMYKEYTKKIAGFVGQVLSAVMLIISIILVKKGLMAFSTFVIITMYKNTILNSSEKISDVIDNFELFNISMDRIYSIVDNYKDTYGNKTLKNVKGEISFQNISFGYNEKKLIFDNFSLEIPANSFTVLLGKNGAGKTTLFSLLTKVITPQSGKILIDSVEMEKLDEDSIHSNISQVNQQPYIFDMTIKENLAMVDDDFDKIKEVCKLVGLDKKIESMKNGYDTYTRQNAANLSGGEKQKLAIARVLLMKSKILLLDEITNNLDNETIESIIKLIKKLKDKYTIIMISHNIKVVNNADRVVILENGKIVGDGNPNKLKKDNEYFKKIFKGKVQ